MWVGDACARVLAWACLRLRAGERARARARAHAPWRNVLRQILRNPPPSPPKSQNWCPWGGVRGGETGQEHFLCPTRRLLPMDSGQDAPVVVVVAAVAAVAAAAWACPRGCSQRAGLRVTFKNTAAPGQSGRGVQKYCVNFGGVTFKNTAADAASKVLRFDVKTDLVTPGAPPPRRGSTTTSSAENNDGSNINSHSRNHCRNRSRRTSSDSSRSSSSTGDSKAAAAAPAGTARVPGQQNRSAPTLQ